MKRFLLFNKRLWQGKCTRGETVIGWSLYMVLVLFVTAAIAYNSTYTGANVDQGVANGLAVGGATGIIKSDGAHGISAATAGTDYVAPGGALGTPSSGDGTNLTNLPLGSITGMGSGVPAALAVNTENAGAPVLYNGALGTPSSGSATNLTNHAPEANQTQTIADSGDGNPAADTITFTTDLLVGHKDITCSDADGCTATMSETSAVDGQVLVVTNVSANTLTFSDSAGVQELPATCALGQYETLTLIYNVDRWVEKSRATNSIGVTSIASDVVIADAFCIACSDESTDLTTGTAKITFRMPYAMTLDSDGLRASVNTAPVGSTIIVDVNEGGSTIMAVTKLSIDASEETSTTAAAAAVISDTALADDAEITVDIDQIGSSTAGKGLKLCFRGTRSW